jgi:hypothetical protein
MWASSRPCSPNRKRRLIGAGHLAAWAPTDALRIVLTVVLAVSSTAYGGADQRCDAT